MCEISPVLPQDLTALYAIEQAAHLIPWSEGTLKNNIGKNYCNLKLCLEKKIVGFAICQVVLDEATLFNLAIHPSVQHQGYGEKLLTALCQQLRERNIQTLWLEVRQSNLAAQRLYDKLGFNIVSQRKNYYPTLDNRREDAIIMANYL